MYGYVYITTNKINNKKYIGQHKADNFDVSYKGSGKLLLKAIEKYGWNNFETKILECCDSQDELNEKEIYYINLYNATNLKEYYNIARGGLGHSCDPWNKGKHSVQEWTVAMEKAFEKGKHLPASEKLKEKLINRKELVEYTKEYRDKLSKANSEWFINNPSGILYSPEGKRTRVLIKDIEEYFNKGYTCGPKSKLYEKFKLWSSTTKG